MRALGFTTLGLALLLGGCDASTTNETQNAAAPLSGTSEDRASLTGLYERSSPIGGGVRDQMCMVQQGANKAQFGLVVWGGNSHSCSGSGEAVRTGNVLSMAMSGDESCTIEAKIEGGVITLPATVPSGCSYYCGAAAALTDAALTRTGGTPQDALQAKDLVGESLCEGMEAKP